MLANREAAYYNKEILKYPTGFEAIKNVVIDATEISLNADDRYVIESGTVLVESGDKVAPAGADIDEGDVVGILAYTVELFGDNTEHDVPAAAFFWNCIFDSTMLVGYEDNEEAVEAALSSCDFQ
jgi:hypothetical protein